MAVMEPNDFDPDDETGDLSRHGSIRKVLHSLVGTDSLLGKSAKMLDRPKSKCSSLDPDDYTLSFKEYTIISEYNLVVSKHIPGLYVIPSANSELLWFGVIFIRSGVYRGGIFRFILQIPEDFPNSCHPSLVFETKLFHPSVDSETLELNLNTVFSNWSRNFNHIWQVLEYARNIFYHIPAKVRTNKLAAHLFEFEKEEYLRLAKECVQDSQSDIYKSLETDDAHYLKFSRYDESIHGETLSALKKFKNCNKYNGHSSGLSWVKRGSLKPCSANSYF